jgi:hypothetical protein
MEIAYAFFVEAIQLTSDGRVNILGADMRKLDCQGPPPWTVPTISLLVCIEPEGEEHGRLYHLTADLVAPDGTRVNHHVEGTFIAPALEDPEMRAKAAGVVQLNGVSLPVPGVYHMQVRAEDRERGTRTEKCVRLRVTGPPAQPNPA